MRFLVQHGNERRTIDFTLSDLRERIRQEYRVVSRSQFLYYAGVLIPDELDLQPLARVMEIVKEWTISCFEIDLDPSSLEEQVFAQPATDENNEDIELSVDFKQAASEDSVVSSIGQRVSVIRRKVGGDAKGLKERIIKGSKRQTLQIKDDGKEKSEIVLVYNEIIDGRLTSFAKVYHLEGGTSVKLQKERDTWNVYADSSPPKDEDSVNMLSPVRKERFDFSAAIHRIEDSKTDTMAI